MEAMNITLPVQSNFSIFSAIFPGVLLIVKNMMSAIDPRPIIGRLIQKIQVHETFWANAPAAADRLAKEARREEEKEKQQIKVIMIAEELFSVRAKED